MAARALVVWLLFIPIVFVNGLIRERLYRPKVGERTAQQISTVIASAAFVSLAFVLLKDRVVRRGAAALLVTGAGWVVLTVLFEFGFGRYGAKQSWRQLAAAYDPRTGSAWPFFLLVEFVSPLLVRLLRTVH
ncbi:MAG: hypothetical protein U0556_07535 [Dehalococcoidia bacterium]